jgi:hypothetical protein
MGDVARGAKMNATVMQYRSGFRKALHDSLTCFREHVRAFAESRMQVAEISTRCLMPSAMALLLVVSEQVAAQAYHPASLDRFEQAPPHVLANSPSAIRALGHDMDLQALDAFEERRAERFSPLERSERWRLYGRFGLLNFQNEPDPNGSGIQVSWRRTGPALGTKIYVGIHRRF